MKRSIRTPLALFGLLLAVAMVCTTSAQAPKPEGLLFEKPDPAGKPEPSLFEKPKPAESDPSIFATPKPAESDQSIFATPVAPAAGTPDAANTPQPVYAAPAQTKPAEAFYVPKPGAVPTMKSDAPAVGTPVAPNAPGVGFNYQSTQPQPQQKIGHAAPLIVGRYQIVSHNGQLIMLDTATGECYTRNGSAWESLGPAIDPNASISRPHYPDAPPYTPQRPSTKALEDPADRSYR